MTAENSNDNTSNNADSTDTTNTAQSIEIPNEIAAIFEFLSFNKDIVFKSQQIDDAELQREEKVKIAKTIYTKNRQTFLCRFGAYFQEQHLRNFQHFVVTDATQTFNADEHCDEMNLMISDFQSKLQTRKRDVKNRRYAAMQQLIKNGEYFSEQEMIKRAPELYQELVGQYLSEAEKKKRDCYDVKNTTFSGILLHTMQQQQMSDVLQRADKTNKEKDEQLQVLQIDDDSCYSTDSVQTNPTTNTNAALDESQSVTSTSQVDAEVPVGCRQQWGNFDNEQIACSTSRETSQKNEQPQFLTKLKSKQRDANAVQNLITAGERELLRQEFIGLMHEQFLAGNDVEFDYTQVDNNTDYDDLNQLNQDKEDLYFTEETDSDEEQNNAVIRRAGIGAGAAIFMDDEEDEASEDELDVYMRHLSQHHSLQKT